MKCRTLLVFLATGVPSVALGSAELPCDLTIQRSIVSATAVDTLVFSAVDGELVNIALGLASGTNFNPTFQLLRSNGVLQGPANAAPQEFDYTLASAFSPYRLLVWDAGANGTGSYSAHLQRLNTDPCDAPALACDVTHSGTLTNGIESDLWSFTVVEGEMVGIQLEFNTNPNFNPVYRVLNRFGHSILIHSQMNFGPLPASGNPYVVEVRDEECAPGGINCMNAGGNYAIHLQRFDPTTSCDATNLDCDVTYHGTLGSGIDTDLWSFDGSNGELVEILVGNVGGLGFVPRFRLLNGDGLLSGGPHQAPGNIVYSPLSASSSPYRIEVFDGFAHQGGTYSIRLQRLAAVPGCNQDATWICDTDTLELDSPVDSDLFTVVFRDGTPLDICVTPLAAGLQPIWRLLDVDGNEASACGTFRNGCSTCGPIATGAPFRVEVVESGLNNAGAYVISISCDPTDSPEELNALPRGLVLHSNTPNPFNPMTTIDFELPSEGPTKLEIYSLAGRAIEVLVDRPMAAGRHLVRWNAAGLPSGIYLARLSSTDGVRTSKLTLVR